MNAKSERSYRWLFWLVAVLGFVGDQASKYGIFSLLYPDGRQGTHEILGGVEAEFDTLRGRIEGHIDVLPNAFQLIAQYTGQYESGDGLGARLRTLSSDMLPRVNHGALFGLGGRNEKGNDANTLFAVVSLVAAAAIVFWSTRPLARSDRFLCLSLGLILAG